MSLFSKATSLLKRLQSQSASTDPRKIGHEVMAEENRLLIGADPINPSLAIKNACVPQSSGLSASDRANEPSFEEIPSLSFEAETSAENYFDYNPARKARGVFRRVDIINWDHEETDWEIRELETDSNFIMATGSQRLAEGALRQDLWKYALLVMSMRPNGETTTRELIELIPQYLSLSAEQLAHNSSRKDSKFSQIVRNLKSHKKSKSNFICQGYADDIRGGFRITEKGLNFVRDYFRE